MSDLDVSFTWSIVKTSYNHCNCFWVIKFLLKLLTFFVKIAQNWWKWPKRLWQYFPEDHRYDCNCFRSLSYTPRATSHPNIIAVNRILQNPPLIFSQQLPFLAFLGRFWHIRHPISKFSQHLLTKNSENVFHAIKSPHPKYHVIIITSSKKIRFWKSRGWRTPFEITTFIFLFFVLFFVGEFIIMYKFWLVEIFEYKFSVLMNHNIKSTL